MLNQTRIPFLITSSYALLLILIIGLGSLSLGTATHIWWATEGLYSHSFLASNTALETRGKIHELRNLLFELTRDGGEKKIDTLSSAIRKLEQEIHSEFQAIRAATPDDRGDIGNTQEQFADWLNIKTQIITLIRNGKREQARQLATSDSEASFKRIRTSIDGVIARAQQEAQQLSLQARRITAEKTRAIRWLTLGLILSSGLFIVMSRQRILKELQQSRKTELALQESEKKFRLLFNSTHDSMLLLTKDRNCVDINFTAHNSLGYDKQDMLGKPFTDFVTEQEAAIITSRLDNATGDNWVTFETTRVDKNGQELPSEITLLPVVLDSEQLYFLVIRDIAERKSFENELKMRESRYRAVIETSADGFWIVDMQGRLLEVNDAYVHLSGYSREELLTMTIPDVEAREQAEDTAAHIAKIIEHGHDRFESAHRRKDGSVWPVEVVVSFWPDLGGTFFVFVTDITERKRREEQQRLAMLVFQNIGEAMIVTDADNRIITVNSAYTELTGYSAKDVIGTTPNLFKPGICEESLRHRIENALQNEGQWQGEFWDQRRDGERIAEWVTLSTIYDDSGIPLQRLILFSDITRKKHNEETIWRHANFDPLTQLPNRRMFRCRLEQEVRKSRRSGKPLALLFIDLDRFKEVNDTLGHSFGDKLLIEAAQRIATCVRTTDIVARLGGDEFTVVLCEVSNTNNLEHIAETIVNKLHEPYRLDNETAYISASIGITMYPDDAMTTDNLLKNADQAMYNAKTLGRGRFSYFTPELEARIQNRHRLISDLYTAVEQEQFLVYFQPIVNLGNGRIEKAEALLRWQHPEKGIIAPLDFIPLAEEIGLINDIGKWVCRQSMHWAKRWSELAPGDFQISINKSPAEFMSDTCILEKDWMDGLEDMGVSGNNFVIEITEGLLLQANQEVQEKFIALRDAGIQVAIDDFGIGYSALSYINKFDIDYLKIDKSFIYDIADNRDERTLIEAIIVMAQKLGLKVIAEGVETEAQLQVLQAAGCDYIQGYLLSRPLTAEQFEQLLIAPSFDHDIKQCNNTR